MEIVTTKDKSVTKTGVQLLTKSIGSLIVSTTVALESLTTEQIKVEVEKKDGNLDITRGFMPLLDFILMTTVKEDAITSDSVYATTAKCEICEEGSIELAFGDTIKIELIGLKTVETYVLNGIEEPQSSNRVLSFENKSMAAADKSRIFDTLTADVVLIDNDSTIEEVAYTFANGVVVKYTLHELRVLARSIDQISYVKANGTVQSGFASKLQLPLFGVNSIEVRKQQTNVINLLIRSEA